MASSTPVREVMTTEVVTITPDATFEAAADLLAEHRIGAVPVVDADGAVVGLLRDEDLILSEANIHAPTWFSFLGAEFPLPGQAKRFEEELERMTAATVVDLMETDFPTCGPDDTLGTVAAAMHERDVTHMPVIEGGALVGIVARGDLVRRVAADT